MAAEQEHIEVSSKDLRELGRVGIHKDDLIDVIHAVAADIESRGETALKPRPSSLSSAEIAILQASGARGLTAEGASAAPGRRQMAVMRLELEYRKVLEASLDGNQVAKLLQVTPSRVRQLATPGNPGLYSFRSRSGDRRFPTWQFDDGVVIPHLRELLKALSPEVHPVTVHRFMTTEHPDLETPALDQCLSPRDWLITGHKPEAVMMLARDL